MVTKEVQDESFFNFFKDSVAPDAADEAKEPGTEEMEAEERFHNDYDMGSFLKDESIPYSLEYYLGLKMEDLDGDEDGFEDMGEEDGDPDMDDEEEEEKVI